MALDLNLKIVTARTINTGAGTSDNSPTFDFSSTTLPGTGGTLGTLGDREPFPEGATLVVVCTTAPAAGNLPVRCNLEVTIDGTNFRRICSVTFTNAAKAVKSARFGLLDLALEAAVVASTDRAAAVNLGVRVVTEYTTSAGSFVYDAFIAGPHSYASANE